MRLCFLFGSQSIKLPCKGARDHRHTTRMADFESDQFKRARGLLADAEKLMSSGQTRWLFFKDGPDYVKAAETFTDAANAFKVAKAWQESGDAFMKASEAFTTGEEPEEAARRLVNAASSYKKSDPSKAIEALTRATNHFLRVGRFNLAATYEKEMAEIFEEMGDLPKAAENWERAAERYMAEDAKATALGCQLKAGNLMAQVENYERAVKIFSEIVKQWAGDELKRYSMKDYLVRLGMSLLLQGDMVAAQREMARFGQLDSNFATTHESRLLTVRMAIT